MLIKDYVSHCDKILSGLESLKALNEANIPNFKVKGILIEDKTREAFDIISIRELIHTFQSEFKITSTLLHNEEYREYEI